MSIGEVIPARCVCAQQGISEEVKRFLDAGGEIHQVPRGRSGVNLRLERGVDGKLRWVNQKLQFKANASKLRSICR